MAGEKISMLETVKHAVVGFSLGVAIEIVASLLLRSLVAFKPAIPAWAQTLWTLNNAAGRWWAIALGLSLIAFTLVFGEGSLAFLVRWSNSWRAGLVSGVTEVAHDGCSSTQR